ncbi:TIGR00341 family protein [Candidatus Kaiserbacteria bacterium]|nr:TIGR00341 family protein [Candidatus Kaiserbacteria bacterium]
MSIFARFQAIDENRKAAVVRKLMQNGTPDFDFFYLIGLSTLMATFGLLLDSPSIVIGSMLIAPLMYPILGVAVGLVMSNWEVFNRSAQTLTNSLMLGLILATVAAFFFGDQSMYLTHEVLSRTEPTYLYLIVAVIAGAAVAYTLAQPEWNETLPGIAISVALIPPLSVVGIGIAALNAEIIKGAVVILLLNIIGIIASAAASFMMMNLYRKQDVATATIKREDERVREEEEAIEKITNQKDETQHHDTHA